MFSQLSLILRSENDFRNQETEHKHPLVSHWSHLPVTVLSPLVNDATRNCGREDGVRTTFWCCQHPPFPTSKINIHHLPWAMVVRKLSRESTFLYLELLLSKSCLRYWFWKLKKHNIFLCLKKPNNFLFFL